MSDQQDRPPLEEWQRVCDAATPGPWEAQFGGLHVTSSAGTGDRMHCFYKRDGMFAASARTALPATIAYALRLEQERDAALAEVERLRGLQALTTPYNACLRCAADLKGHKPDDGLCGDCRNAQFRRNAGRFVSPAHGQQL